MYAAVKYPNNRHTFIQKEANIVSPPENIIAKNRRKSALQEQYPCALDGTNYPFGWVPPDNQD